MKLNVRRFKSLAVGLKELERFIRDGQHLYTGRPFKGLEGMRSREAVANWLMCAAISFERGRSYCFTSDPQGGDGIIYDSVNKQEWPTEHIFVPRAKPEDTKDIDNLILDAVQAKESKGGAAYATGKTLIVFLDAGSGEWKPSLVARKLPPGFFMNVWVVGLQGVSDEGKYTYGVTCLRTGIDLQLMDAPTWLVSIDKTFESWAIKRLQ